MIPHCKSGGMLCLLLISFSIGCRDISTERAAVSGQVTLDGQPLDKGIVRFVPIEGTLGQKLSASVESGRFQLPASKGPAIGTHRVEIESSDTGGLEMDDEDAISHLKSKGIRRIQVEQVPQRFNTHSVLKVAVSGTAPNEFSFELSTQRRN